MYISDLSSEGDVVGRDAFVLNWGGGWGKDPGGGESDIIVNGPLLMNSVTAGHEIESDTRHSIDLELFLMS